MAASNVVQAFVMHLALLNMYMSEMMQAGMAVLLHSSPVELLLSITTSTLCHVPAAWGRSYTITLVKMSTLLDGQSEQLAR